MKSVMQQLAEDQNVDASMRRILEGKHISPAIGEFALTEVTRLVEINRELLVALDNMILHFDEADCTTPAEFKAVVRARVAIAKAESK